MCVFPNASLPVYSYPVRPGKIYLSLLTSYFIPVNGQNATSQEL